MKFWKSLSNLIEETLPDWRDKFLSYKDLKKQLKLIYPKDDDGDDDGGGSCKKRLRLSGGVDDDPVAVAVAKEVVDFVELLEDEIDKFNAFFMDKEEEYIIKLKVMKDKVAEAKDSSEELMKVGRDLVDFHGEMVLLENYSALNYTGLVKILKKYDKLSGALIRSPFIQKVLREPFYTTDVLNKLVKECESMLDQLFSMNERSASFPSASTNGKDDDDHKPSSTIENKDKSLKVPEELTEIENMESTYVKLTLSALRVLKEIRSGSSTVSMFSLPPMQSKDLEVWKTSSVLEQAAK